MILSIIIPARHEEAAIGKTVSQFASLSISHEVIVSDGRSTDRTVECAREAGAKVVIFAGTKHTASIGRNDGAMIAEGDYLVFIDGDTTIPDPEQFFARALKDFQNNPKLVGVTGPQHAYLEVETWADRASFGYLNWVISFQNNVLHRGEASGKFMMVTREAYDAVNGFREDLVTREDGDFFYRISKQGATFYDSSLHVFHGARRAHRIGWARLWFIWTINVISVVLRDRSASKDWTPIR